MDSINQRLKNFGKGVFLFLLLQVSSMAEAQTDACMPVGWVNYTNSTSAGVVTGGGAVSAVTVTTIAQLKTEANSVGAKVIYVQGSMGAGYSNGAGERVDVKSDKTIIGFEGATVRAFFSIKNATNIIIRNLIIQGPGAQDVDGWDNITIDNSTRVWIDHCDLRDGEDGNCDIKNASNNVTITWTKFSYTNVTQSLGALNHSFSNLIGSDDGDTQDAGKLKVTFQYNWWDGAVERMPRVRFGQVHVVNNLFTEVAGFPQSKTGVTAGLDADVRVESNSFVGIDDPIDVSKLAGTAKIQSISNLFTSTTGNSTGSGTAFVPPYTLAIAANTTLNTTTFKNCVGATLTDPPASTCPCSGTLPVTLVSFTVKSLAEEFLLQWTLKEIEQLDKVILETSEDGSRFAPYAILSNTSSNYALSIEEILHADIRYVRLKFLEENGSISFSPVRSIHPQADFYVYPNPCNDRIFVKGMNEGSIKIYTIDGQLVVEDFFSESVAVPIENLKSGTYYYLIKDVYTSELKRGLLVKL